MIQQCVFAILSGNAAVVAAAPGGIFPVALPEGQASWPALTFQLISGSLEPTLDGKQTSEARVQVDAWGDSYLNAQSAAAAVAAAMNNYSGIAGSQTILVSYSSITQDTFETDSRIYRVMTEYIISFV